MSRKVLITRPVEDASPLKARLAVMGLETLENPILKIVYNDEKSISLDGVQAILFTSANGVRSFTRCDDNRSLPVLTVGNASARAAEEAGFQQVESADGNVDALAALINKRLDPKKGTLLHVAASRVAGDLAESLEKGGFDVRREVLYSAQVAEQLNDKTQQALKDGQLDAVLLYSPRTAIAFVSLIRAAGLEECCRTVTVFCLSSAVANAISMIAWRSIEVAVKPNQDDLLDMVSAWSQA
ncbi:MAG: uroporphyrinogen-III synthase [Rhodospirillales bacterium]